MVDYSSVNYEKIELNHIVVFSQDSTVFAAGRERDNNRIRIFVINEKSGNVYSRNGLANSWQEIYGIPRATVINNIETARIRKLIPVYTVNDRLNA
jgi:hypothetical protein